MNVSLLRVYIASILHNKDPCIFIETFTTWPLCFTSFSMHCEIRYLTYLTIMQITLYNGSLSLPNSWNIRTIVVSVHSWTTQVLTSVHDGSFYYYQPFIVSHQNAAVQMLMLQHTTFRRRWKNSFKTESKGLFIQNITYTWQKERLIVLKQSRCLCYSTS